MKRWLALTAGLLVLGLMGWGIFKGISSLIEKFRSDEPGNSSIALSAGFVSASPVNVAVPETEAALPDAETGEAGEAKAADAAGAAGADDKSGVAEAPEKKVPLVFEIRGSVQRDGQPIREGKVRLTVSLVGERFRQSTLTDLDKNGEFLVRDHAAFRSLRSNSRIRVLAEVWPASRRGTGVAEPLTEMVYLNHPLPSWIRSSTGYIVLGGLLLFATLFLWSFTGANSYAKNRLAIILSYSVIFLSLGGAVVGPTLLMLAVPDLPEISGKAPVGLVVAKLTEESKPEWMLNLGGYVEKKDVIMAAEDEGIGAPVLRIVTLNGGIQIPLYVILLALIGGAINMTRQVPGFQSRQPARKGFWHRMVSGAPSSQDNQQDKSEEEENGWRKGLLEQYMFLIAAPFLAIATYYLLILLGQIQPPIIVLVCFSIGLISDTVVNAITVAAKKLLGGKTLDEEKDEDEEPSGSKATEQEAANANVAPIHTAGEKAEEEKDKAA